MGRRGRPDGAAVRQGLGGPRPGTAAHRAGEDPRAVARSQGPGPGRAQPGAGARALRGAGHGARRAGPRRRRDHLGAPLRRLQGQDHALAGAAARAGDPGRCGGGEHRGRRQHRRPAADDRPVRPCAGARHDRRQDLLAGRHPPGRQRHRPADHAELRLGPAAAPQRRGPGAHAAAAARCADAEAGHPSGRQRGPLAAGAGACGADLQPGRGAGDQAVAGQPRRGGPGPGAEADVALAVRFHRRQFGGRGLRRQDRRGAPDPGRRRAHGLELGLLRHRRHVGRLQAGLRARGRIGPRRPLRRHLSALRADHRDHRAAAGLRAEAGDGEVRPRPDGGWHRVPPPRQGAGRHPDPGEDRAEHRAGVPGQGRAGRGGDAAPARGPDHRPL